METDLDDYVSQLVEFINESKPIDRIQVNSFFINLEKNLENPWIKGVRAQSFEDVRDLACASPDDLRAGRLDYLVGQNEYLKGWLIRAKELGIRSNLQRFTPPDLNEIFDRAHAVDMVPFLKDRRCVQGLNPKKCHEVVFWT